MAKIPHTQRYFVTRGVIFCSARKGCPNWTKVPRVFKHATAFVWFYGDPTTVRRELIDSIGGSLTGNHRQSFETYAPHKRGSQANCTMLISPKSIMSLAT